MSRSKQDPAKNDLIGPGTFNVSRMPVWTVVVLLFSLAFLFYGNTLRNDIALDDTMVLANNTFVQSGISGIPDIFKHDSFYGATHRPASQLSWRYRPLSLAFFALLHQFFGNDWSVYHFFNILLYGLSCVVVFFFLKRHVFSNQPLPALLGALLFLIHPIHTEVVANIKSCDELLSFLFILVTYDRLLCFVKNDRRTDLLFALAACSGALFSKESSLLMIALLPLLLTVFSLSGLAAGIRKSLPFAALSILFLLVRLSVSQLPETANDLPNSPYLLAAPGQKIATVILVLGYYLQLLFYPSPLIFDYGYNHIPYVGFDDHRFQFAALVYLLLTGIAVAGSLRRQPVGFFMTAYLLGILFISNLFFDVGPIMADRFLYTPGFFLIIALLLLAMRALEALIPRRKDIVLLSLLIVAAPFAFAKTVSRNAEWKDNRTLYAADLLKAPDSYRVLAFNAMVICEDAGKTGDSLKRADMFREAIRLFRSAYSIFPDYKMMYNNWGLAYYSLGQLDSAEWAWGRQRQLYPDSRYNAYNKELLDKAKYERCLQLYNARYKDGDNYPLLKKILLEALTYRPEESAGWTILGKVYYLNRQADSARICWRKAVELDSSNAEAKSLMDIR